MTTADTTTIRKATRADLPDLLAFLVCLADHSAYTPAVGDVTSAEQRLRALLDNPDFGCWIVTDEEAGIVGSVGMLLYDHLVSGVRQAGEAWWYVQPDWRGGPLGDRLLTMAETWARRQGARRLQMLAPASTFMAFYRRRGYVETDHVFERSL